MAAISLLVLMTACSGDDAPALKPILPAWDGDPVKSIQNLGTVESSYDWTFAYNGGRLVQAVGVVRDDDEQIDGSYSYTSRLSYAPNRVTINNSSGEQTRVTLNSQGLIERMTVNRNIYEFQYSDGRLSGWNKTVFENSFGQVIQYRSSATITYSGGDLASIAYMETGGDPVILTFTPSNELNRNGLLPCSVSKEMGCLGFEHLYYAGLLGQSTIHLVRSIDVKYTDGSKQDYTQTFEYGRRGNNVVLCTYHTPADEPVSVSYAY